MRRAFSIIELEIGVALVVLLAGVIVVLIGDCFSPARLAEGRRTAVKTTSLRESGHQGHGEFGFSGHLVEPLKERKQGASDLVKDKTVSAAQKEVTPTLTIASATTPYGTAIPLNAVVDGVIKGALDGQVLTLVLSQEAASVETLTAAITADSANLMSPLSLPVGTYTLTVTTPSFESGNYTYLAATGMGKLTVTASMQFPVLTLTAEGGVYGDGGSVTVALSGVENPTAWEGPPVTFVLKEEQTPLETAQVPFVEGLASWSPTKLISSGSYTVTATMSDYIPLKSNYGYYAVGTSGSFEVAQACLTPVLTVQAPEVVYGTSGEVSVTVSGVASGALEGQEVTLKLGDNVLSGEIRGDLVRLPLPENLAVGTYTVTASTGVFLSAEGDYAYASASGAGVLEVVPPEASADAFGNESATMDEEELFQ